MSTTHMLSILDRALESLPLSGSLENFGGYSLLKWAEATQFTGDLHLSRKDRRKKVSIISGFVSEVQSNLLSEDPELNPSIGTFNRQTRLEDRLLNLLGWFDGDYRFEKKSIKESESQWISLKDFLERTKSCLVHGQIPFLLPTTFSVRGSLSQVGGAFTLMSAMQSFASGTLLFEKGVRRKLFTFDEGRVVSISTTDPSETLRAILERFYHMPSQELDQLQRRSHDQGRRFREILRDENILSLDQINQALVFMHEERLIEAFSWRSGSWEFQGDYLKERTPEITEKSDTPRRILVLTENIKSTEAWISEQLKNASSNGGPPPQFQTSSYTSDLDFTSKYDLTIFWIEKDRTSRKQIKAILDRLPNRENSYFIYQESLPTLDPEHNA